jgi:hypothetical protein
MRTYLSAGKTSACCVQKSALPILLIFLTPVAAAAPLRSSNESLRTVGEGVALTWCNSRCNSLRIGAYYNLPDRLGQPKAITATARKLAILVYRVLRDEIS